MNYTALALIPVRHSSARGTVPGSFCASFHVIRARTLTDEQTEVLTLSYSRSPGL